MGKIKILLVCLCCVLTCTMFVFMTKFLPEFVSYEENNSSESKVLNASSEQYVIYQNVKYKRVEEITERPPFVIKSDQNNIYVYKQDKRLYSVRTNLSDFPEADIALIKKGIVADDFSQLCEIVSYMES